MQLLFVTASLGLGGSEKCMVEMIHRIDLNRFDVTVLALMHVKTTYAFDPRVRVINGIPAFERLNMPMSIYARKAVYKGNLFELYRKSVYWFCTKIKRDHVSKYFWKTLSRFIPEHGEAYDVVIGYGQGLATFFAIDKVPNANKRILWVNTDLKNAGYDIDYMRQFYLSADIVAADSEHGKHYLAELYPEKAKQVVCFQNMLNNDEILRAAQAQMVLSMDNSKVKVLTVGRIVEAKALHLAVEAAAILKERKIPFNWYFIGDGNLKTSIEKLIHKLSVQDCVHLLGIQKNPYPWFANCDVYVQTSIYEGSCMVINEALIFAKPVVSTNFPAAYEKIQDEKNGLICDMCSESIANCLERLIVDKKMRQNMEDYIQNHHSQWESNIQQFYDMIEGE